MGALEVVLEAQDIHGVALATGLEDPLAKLRDAQRARPVKVQEVEEGVRLARVDPNIVEHVDKVLVLQGLEELSFGEAAFRVNAREKEAVTDLLDGLVPFRRRHLHVVLEVVKRLAHRRVDDHSDDHVHQPPRSEREEQEEKEVKQDCFKPLLVLSHCAHNFRPALHRHHGQQSEHALGDATKPYSQRVCVRGVQSGAVAGEEWLPNHTRGQDPKDIDDNEEQDEGPYDCPHRADDPHNDYPE
mmetsp:Transcript_88234/g.274256  ORF Transcript_88234/g.274256 Transcript_88234/m.274256 type:complete len:243 (+) Transcript_88234:271-999(+)